MDTCNAAEVKPPHSHAVGALFMPPIPNSPPAGYITSPAQRPNYSHPRCLHTRALTSPGAAAEAPKPAQQPLASTDMLSVPSHVSCDAYSHWRVPNGSGEGQSLSEELTKLSDNSRTDPNIAELICTRSASQRVGNSGAPLTLRIDKLTQS